MKNRILIVISLTILFPFVLHAADDNVIDFIDKDPIKIEAVIPFNNKNFVLISYGTLGSRNNYEAMLFVIGEDGEILSNHSCYYRGGLNGNVFLSDNYIGIEINTIRSSVIKTIAVYSIIENKFYSYKSDETVITQFHIDNNFIYFSVEEQYCRVNTIDRKTGTIKRFQNFFLNDPSFVEHDNNVYVFDYNSDAYSFLILNGELVKKEMYFENWDRNQHMLDFRPAEDLVISDLIAEQK